MSLGVSGGTSVSASPGALSGPQKPLPTVTNHDMRQSLDQPPAVGIVADSFLSGISSCYHVIDGTLEINPKSAWHAWNPGGFNPTVK